MESKSQAFHAQKMISVVRNPMDVIKESGDAKNLFGCHDRLRADNDYHTHHLHWWEKWVAIQTENLANESDYILTSVASKMPTLFVRYEDLFRDPVPVLTDVFKFCLNTDSLKGTVVERRINEVCLLRS